MSIKFLAKNCCQKNKLSFSSGMLNLKQNAFRSFNTEQKNLQFKKSG